MRFVSYAFLALCVWATTHATPVAAQAAPLRVHASLEVPALRLSSSAYLQVQAVAAQPGQYAVVQGGTHPDIGLVVAGSITLGLGYLTSVVFGVLGNNAILYIPVIGGIIHAPLNGTGGGIALGLSVSAAQIVGLIILIVGAVANIPDDPLVASAAPRLVPGPGDAGGALRWRF